MSAVAELRPIVEFVVRGIPQTMGSVKVIPGRRFPVKQHSQALGSWQEAIRQEAQRAVRGADAIQGPLGLVVTFYLQRPKGHYGSRGNILPSAPPYPAGKPDLDKLVRALKDGLTGIVWRDDSQVVDTASRKRWSETPGCRVAVTSAGDELIAFRWGDR